MVDLSGTARQVDDKPINMPLVGTVDCSIWLTIRSILLEVIYGYTAKLWSYTPDRDYGSRIVFKSDFSSTRYCALLPGKPTR